MLCLVAFSFQDTQAQDWAQKAKAVPVPYLQTLSNQNFGNSVAIDGAYAVVGAPGYENNSGATFVYFFNGSVWTLLTRLKASDLVSNDRFGSSVSISGDNIVIGSYRAAYVYTKPASGWTEMTQTAKFIVSDVSSVCISEDNIVVGAKTNNSNIGSAYVYTKPVSGWADNTQAAILTASDGATNDYFGNSVSISGDNIVIGAYGDNDNGAVSGSAYLFTKPVLGWMNMTQAAKLKPSDGATGDYFGYSVSISGDNIVIGSYSDDDNGSASGSAYVFAKPLAGWTSMTQTAKIKPSDGGANDFFGYSVNVSADTVVVGAYGSDNVVTEAGAAYIFVKPEAGWTSMIQTAKISTSDTVNYGRFGCSVAFSGSNILIGALNNSDTELNSGAVYCFRKPVSGWNNMIQTQRILIPVYFGNLHDYYGYSVAIDGDYAVIGSNRYKDSQGIAYVLHYDGNTWITQAKLTASDGSTNQYFGESVGISEDNIVVGAFYDSENGNTYCGSAYVFTKPASGWTDMTQTAKLSASDGAGGDYFGRSVCISGENIVVGAYTDDNSMGSAYVFTKPVSGWVNMTQTAKLTATDRNVSDYFGYSVSISGDNVVIGAYGDDDNGSSSGSAYLFTKPAFGWVNMTQTAKIKPSDGIPGGCFGFAVDISGNALVVGAPCSYGSASSSAYVFVKPTLGWGDMTQTAKLIASDCAIDDFFGRSVRICGDNIVVGSDEDDDNGYQSGSVYVFSKPASGWSQMMQTDKIKSIDGSDNDHFGESVGITNNYIIVGAPYENGNGFLTGSVYLFEKCVPTASTDIHAACDTYTWINGITYTESNNTATDTLVNFAGCDSIVTLNLTIKHSTFVTDVHFACDSYTWIDGNTYTSSNNSATYITSNSVGCDSVITLNLTINSVNSIIDQASSTLTANPAGGTYKWLNCNGFSPISGQLNQVYIPTANGSYAVEVTKFGCVDTSSCVNVTTVGVIESIDNSQFQLFPNPTTGEINIKMNEINSSVKINVLDVTGKLVSSYEYKDKQLITFTINESPGFYFVEVLTDFEKIRTKIIKQ